MTDACLQLAVLAAPESGWRLHGPLGAGAWHLRTALLRLLWFALRPAQGISQMPAGWFRGQCGDVVTLDFSGGAACPGEISTQLDGLFAGRPDGFGEWVLGKSVQNLPLFEKAMLQADIEFLNESFGLQTKPI